MPKVIGKGDHNVIGKYLFDTKADTSQIFSGDYNNLSNKPSLFDGNYNNLSNRPTIPTNNNQLSNGRGFVTTSGITQSDGDSRYIKRGSNSGSPDITGVDDISCSGIFADVGNGGARRTGFFSTCNATTFQGGHHDFAEFFETYDGNAISPGYTVVLQDGKIKTATSSDSTDDIIGVIRENNGAMIVGNHDSGVWQGKYLRTEFGSPIYNEDGSPSINPEFDDTLEYKTREERPEWQTVGLVGQVQILTGQPVNSRWRKMKDIRVGLELWYIR